MRFRRRLLLLYILFCVALGLVWMRAAQMILLDGDEWARRALKLRQHTERLEALRGPIVSADGAILAEDVAVFQLAVVGWEWRHRKRARCPDCGLVHFQGASKHLPRRCACLARWQRGGGTRRSDAYPRGGALPEGPTLERLPEGDLRPLEAALGVEPGALAELAEARVAEIEKLVEEYERRLRESDEDSDFLIDDKVELRRNDLLMRPFVLETDVSDDVVRLVQTDEVGRFRGFRIQTTLRRRYPMGDFAAQLLGFTSVIKSDEEYRALRKLYGKEHITPASRRGRAGLERAWDRELRGRSGRRLMQLEPQGTFSLVIEDVPPEPGRPLRLTLSADATLAAQRYLEQWASPGGYLPAGQPSAGFVLLDAREGQILAWGEAPRFDINTDLEKLYDKTLTEAVADRLARLWFPRHDLGRAMTLEEWRAQVVKPVPRSLSRVAQVAIEPGSTMKPLIALGLLESRLPMPYEGYVCRHGGGKPGCHACGEVFLERAIARSCNRYFAYSLRDAPSWKTNRTFVADFVHQLGLGQRPDPAMNEWAAGQWLWDWVDFPLDDPVRRASESLKESMEGRAPTLRLQVHPRVPGTVGGDPERLGRTLAKIARHVAERAGTKDVAVHVTREGGEGSHVVLRFGVRAAKRPGWFALPDAQGAAGDLPPVLRGRDAHKAGVAGRIARGGTVWFTARFERRMGRDDPRQPLVIRPDDGRNVAIGQGPVLTTPLQMARAMAAIANGGNVVTPHLVRRAGRGPTPRSLRIDPAHLARVRSGMYDVVNSSFGTARGSYWNDVPATVYGKTGTSQVGGPWKPWKQVDDDEGPWHHWFVGFAEAPGRRPVAFACVLHARTEAGASMTAARCTGDILAQWYQLPESMQAGE